MPPADFSLPGWRISHGQALWRSGAGGPEIAGELLLATHVHGQAFVQFSKTPLPILIARTTRNGWRIEFIARNQTLTGRGEPPGRLGWLHLARCLAGTNPPTGWSFQQSDGGTWRLENRKSGELLEGYLIP
jgi:hypothetical protein